MTTVSTTRDDIKSDVKELVDTVIADKVYLRKINEFGNIIDKRRE